MAGYLLSCSKLPDDDWMTWRHDHDTYCWQIPMSLPTVEAVLILQHEIMFIAKKMKTVELYKPKSDTMSSPQLK